MWMARKVEQQVQKSCGRGWFHHLNDALNVHPGYEKEGGALHGLGGCSLLCVPSFCYCRTTNA